MAEESEDPDEIEKELSSLMESLPGANLAEQEALSTAFFSRIGDWAAKRKVTPRDRIQATFQAARNKRDWTKAESACRLLLSLTDSPMMSVRDWGHLAGILAEQGRHAEAYDATKEATRLAREGDILPLLTMALQDEASYAAKQGETERALACLAEGIERMAAEGDQYAWQHASFLVQRARILLDLGEIERAEGDLDASDATLRPYEHASMLAGPISALASWWFVTAKLRLKKGDLAGARKASEEGLLLGKRVGSMPQFTEYEQEKSLRRSIERYKEIQEALGRDD